MQSVQVRRGVWVAQVDRSTATDAAAGGRGKAKEPRQSTTAPSAGGSGDTLGRAVPEAARRADPPRRPEGQEHAKQGALRPPPPLAEAAATRHSLRPLALHRKPATPKPGGTASSSSTPAGIYQHGASRPGAVPPQPTAAVGAASSTATAQSAGALVIGTEAQMYRILLQFGPPDSTERHKLQQLLAIPCSLCDPNSLMAAATMGIDRGIYQLSRTLRPDIQVSVRAVHLKKAVMQLGADFCRLPGYYCLSAVTVPYSLDDIEASTSEAERRSRRHVWNHIDLRVTSSARYCAGEAFPLDTARRALQESCGVCVSRALWGEQMQRSLRQQLGVDVPLKLQMGPAAWVVALLLPEDASATTYDGVLHFDQPRVAPAKVAPAAATAPTANVAAATRGTEDGRLDPLSTVGDLVVLEELPSLGEGWLRVQSQLTRQIFLFNEFTFEALVASR